MSGRGRPRKFPKGEEPYLKPKSGRGRGRPPGKSSSSGSDAEKKAKKAAPVKPAAHVASENEESSSQKASRGRSKSPAKSAGSGTKSPVKAAAKSASPSASPKKRGRPPKASPHVAPSKAAGSSASASPKKRGRPPGSASKKAKKGEGEEGAEGAEVAEGADGADADVEASEVTGAKKKERKWRRERFGYLSTGYDPTLVRAAESSPVSNVVALPQWTVLSLREPPALLSSSDASRPEYLPVSERSVPIVVGDDPVTTDLKLKLFSCASIQKEKQKDDFLLFVGGAAWAMEWAPLRSNSAEEDQFLAVAPYRELHETHLIGARFAHLNTIQIWNCGPLASPQKERKIPKLSFCITHSHGNAVAIDWCPLGSTFDLPTRTATDTRLGLLACAFSDGFFAVYAVPHPSALPLPNSDEVSLVRLVPVLESQVSSDTAVCTAVRWSVNEARQKSPYLAIGSSDGVISVYDFESENALAAPIFRSVAHPGGVRCISFCPFALAGHQAFASAGHDGAVRIFDVRNGFAPLFTSSSSFSWIVDLQWVNQDLFLAFEDSTVRILNLGGREGTGSTRFLKHHLGSVWTVCMSHWLPKLLSAGSDGSVHVLNTQSAEPEGRVHAIAHEHTADAAAPTSVYRFLLPPLINYTPVEPTGTTPQNGNEPAKTYKKFFDPLVAIVRCRWNQNVAARHWIASASASGIIRIQNTAAIE